MFQDLNRVIEQVGKDKGIGKAVLIDALEQAMLTVSKKKFGLTKELEARYNPDLGEIELFQFKTVVEKVKDPENEITVREARTQDPDAQLGDGLGFKLDVSGLGRIAAQTAKQVIVQRVREAEREMIYSEYKDRKGELLSGLVQRFEHGNIIVDLGRTEAVMPPREQVPREAYRRGDRIRALLLDVSKSTKTPQLLVSRAHPELVRALFDLEVPEIRDSVVKIKGIVREPGSRTKIAVVSDDRDVDPVGACVGVKGSRVQAVVQELRGEKIDIIAWTDDVARLAVNALSPAQVTKVIMDDATKTMEVIVPDAQLSLAIGRKGQNVRLAARLVGWKIDIRSESKPEEQQMAAGPEEGTEVAPAGAVVEAPESGGPPSAA